MTRRLLLVLGVPLLLVAGLLGPRVGAQNFGPSTYYEAVAATQASANVDFGFRAVQVLLINDGANEAYVDFGSTAATTADFELKSGESVALTVPPMQDIAIVCAAGETATVRVLALSN